MSSEKKLFITGATGYIGGSVLESIVQTYPDLHISALLRSAPAELIARYPRVSIVTGTFDDFEVIEQAASDADIVIHTGDTDHEGCARAILSGLSKRKHPSFLLHLSGTGCVSDRLTNTWQGHSNPKIWSDIDDIDDINNLPDTALHRIVDRMIQDASNDLIKTLTICPPDIYGPGKGVGGRTSFIIPWYVAAIDKKKEAFYLGRGENWRAVVHIDDVVGVFILLLGEALRGGGDAQWGREGFYFAASDEVQWKDVAEAVNKLGKDQGWLPPNSEPVSYNAAQVKELLPQNRELLLEFSDLTLYMWGSNSRVSSDRAKKLGWKPKGPDFWTALPQDVESYRSSVAKK